MTDVPTKILRLPCSAVHCLLGTFYMLDANPPYYRANLRPLIATDPVAQSTPAPEGEVGKRWGGSGKRAELATARERGGGNRLGPYGVSPAPPGSAFTNAELESFRDILRAIQRTVLGKADAYGSRLGHARAMLSIVHVPFTKRNFDMSINALSILLEKVSDPWWEKEIRVMTGHPHNELQWLRELLMNQ